MAQYPDVADYLLDDPAMRGEYLKLRLENWECTVMQVSQDFEASAVGAKITDKGDALVTFLTDKGHVVVLMRRVALERLFEQAKSELQRVPRKPYSN
jgi:hypothetical protein